MKKFYQVALVFLLICMMGALCVQCANGQSIIKKKGQWTIFVITDTTIKPTLYDTSWASSPDTILYPVFVHDTIRVHDTSYVQFNIHDTTRITDTINNCGTPVSPTLVSIFTTQTLPTSSSSDGQPITLGVKFRVSATAYMKAVRFYKTANNTGSHKGYLYSSAGAILDSGTFVGEAATGWQTLQLTKDIQLTAGTTYVAAYYSPTGQYSDTNNTFNTAITNGIITGLASGTDGVNGVYSYGNKFSISTFKNSNYWVDAVVSQTK